MKTACCSPPRSLLCLLAGLWSVCAHGFADRGGPLRIHEGPVKINLVSGRFLAPEGADLGAESSWGPRNFLFMGYDVEQASYSLTLVNESKSRRELLIVMNYPFLEDVRVIHKSGGIEKEVGRAGILSSVSPNSREWSVALSLQGNERANLALVFSKTAGRPLATEIFLYDGVTFLRNSGQKQLVIGAYFGLLILSLVFSLMLYGQIRQSYYLLYGLYLILSFIFLASYLGLANALLPAEKMILGRDIYVLSIELSLMVFFLFGQRVLHASEYLPGLKKIVEYLILALVVLRLVLHFAAAELFSKAIGIFMRAWYLAILFMVVVLIVEIVTYLKYNRRIGALFAISFLAMLVGSATLLLHHSFGLFPATFHGLPVILYGSALEILLLSFTLGLIVTQAIRERSKLTEQLAWEQQRFLQAFIEGQEEERRRIGRELHDSLGSKLTALKRRLAMPEGNIALEKALDDVCEDVRNLSHRITPAEIELVGLVEAIRDFVSEIHHPLDLQVRFDAYQVPEELPEPISTHLFRIVQELTQNALKHSRATSLVIQLFGHPKSLTLAVEDNGIGMDESKRSDGLGLMNIRSRVRRMSGELIVDSQPGKGTSVLIILPL